MISSAKKLAYTFCKVTLSHEYVHVISHKVNASTSSVLLLISRSSSTEIARMVAIREISATLMALASEMILLILLETPSFLQGPAGTFIFQKSLILFLTSWKVTPIILIASIFPRISIGLADKVNMCTFYQYAYESIMYIQPCFSGNSILFLPKSTIITGSMKTEVVSE